MKRLNPKGQCWGYAWLVKRVNNSGCVKAASMKDITKGLL